MVFADETEFYATLDAFLSSEEGVMYNSTVVVARDDTGAVSSISAAAIQAEYSGVINGVASKQVKGACGVPSVLSFMIILGGGLAQC